MTTLSLTLPVAGQPSSSEDPKVTTALQAIQSWGNGSIDAGNVTAGSLTAATLDSTTVNAIAGINASGTVRRGKTNISATESRTNTAYGLLTTPDRVQSVVLPTDGLLYVLYQATWQESVAGAARAAIFVGSNQQKIALDYGTAPVTSAAGMSVGGTAATNAVLTSWTGGLASHNQPAGGTAYGGDVTTGQAVGQVGSATVGADGITSEINGSIVYLGVQGGAAGSSMYAGGPAVLFAAAGTYDVSVQFKASSGSVTASNRKLWVWTVGF